MAGKCKRQHIHYTNSAQHNLIHFIHKINSTRCRQYIFTKSHQTRSEWKAILEIQFQWNRTQRSTSNDWLYSKPHQWTATDLRYVWLKRNRWEAHGRFLSMDYSSARWTFAKKEISISFSKQGGHSQGGNIIFILLSERPEYNAKIALVHGMAPAVLLVKSDANPMLNILLDNLDNLKVWLHLVCLCQKDSLKCALVSLRIIVKGFQKSHTLLFF